MIYKSPDIGQTADCMNKETSDLNERGWRSRSTPTVNRGFWMTPDLSRENAYAYMLNTTMKLGFNVLQTERVTLLRDQPSTIN